MLIKQYDKFFYSWFLLLLSWIFLAGPLSAKESCVYISGSSAFCKDTKTGNQTRNFGVKQEKNHGLQWVYDPRDGRLIARENYREGELHGQQEYYNKKGRVAREEFHQPGKKPTKIWYVKFPAKMTRLECGDFLEDSKSNKLCGYQGLKKNKIYSESGHQLRHETWLKGKTHGLQKIFNEEGRLIARRFYQQGNLTDRLEEFNEVGKRIYLYDQKQNQEFFYHPKGLLHAKNTLDEQGLIKHRQVYFLNGFLKEDYRRLSKDLYLQKRFDAVTGQFLSQGQLGTFDLEDAYSLHQEGLWKLYSQQGVLEFEIIYQAGVMQERRSFDPDGSLVKTEIFYEDGSIKEAQQHQKPIAY